MRSFSCQTERRILSWFGQCVRLASHAICNFVLHPNCCKILVGGDTDELHVRGCPYRRACAGAEAYTLCVGCLCSVIATTAEWQLLCAFFAGRKAFSCLCRGQFLKLLQCVDAYFLPALARSGDADARAVHARIHTYIHHSSWHSPPAGRVMPQNDVSSYDRA